MKLVRYGNEGQEKPGLIDQTVSYEIFPAMWLISMVRRCQRTV